MWGFGRSSDSSMLPSMIDPKNGIDPDVYKSAKSPRPLWANLLIFSAVALLVGIVGLVLSSWTLAGAAFIAMLILLIIAGIAALTLVKRPS